MNLYSLQSIPNLTPAFVISCCVQVKWEGKVGTFMKMTKVLIKVGSIVQFWNHPKWMVKLVGTFMKMTKVPIKVGSIVQFWNHPKWMVK